MKAHNFVFQENNSNNTKLNCVMGFVQNWGNSESQRIHWNMTGQQNKTHPWKFQNSSKIIIFIMMVSWIF